MSQLKRTLFDGKRVLVVIISAMNLRIFGGDLLRGGMSGFSVQIGHGAEIRMLGFGFIGFELVGYGGVLLSLQKEVVFCNRFFKLNSAVSFGSFVIDEIDGFDLNYFFK